MTALSKRRISVADDVPGRRMPRQVLAYAAFTLTYFLLAAYAASLPIHANVPLFLWPAHGLALGTLLVAPHRRWPVYLALVLVATTCAGIAASESLFAIFRTCIVNVAQPLVVAFGLQRLAAPAGQINSQANAVQINSVRSLASLLIGMLPLVAIMAIADTALSFVAFEEGSFRQRWSMMFVSTMLGMMLTAPAILAWSRNGHGNGSKVPKERWPELIVLLTLVVVTTHYVFVSRPNNAGFVPPLAYLAAPILVWAALRFGLRTATLALATFGLIAYWHAGQGLGPLAVDVKALLYLQGYLATVIVTTLFAAALLTERQDAAVETMEWRYRHERVIRASASLLYDLDPSTGALVWDGDTLGVLGAPRDQIANARQWMHRVHPDERARLRAASQQLIAGEISHFSMEHRFRRDDGEFTMLGVNGYRIADPSKRGGRRVIGFVRDVSEKVRAEDEKRRLEAQLKQAEKMQAVGHLAGGIAHDFNNILGAILGYGELAQARASKQDETMKRYLDTIMNAGNRAKSLVNQILSYSRAEGSSRIPVVVNAVADEVCELLRGSTSGIDVRYTCEAEGAAVMGDPTRLHQLFMNLCSNAIHAMGEKGSLDIDVSVQVLTAPLPVRSGEVPSGEYVRVSVKDSGHGIAPEVIDRIFEPFFTTKPAGRGTGLGLALVHAVVVEHQGFIDVQSELRRGTTFSVWLPLTHGEAKPTGAATEMQQGLGQVVLAVDDEPEVLAALEEMLATLGYEPAGYGDSREALEAVRENPDRYEAVVSDEVMPGLTGTQLSIELRKLKPDLPILIASGYGGSGFETRALSAGVNRVLKKPYRMSEIADVLAGFFAGK